MASTITQRVAAITIAVLFLVTSLGFSGLVIWEITQQNKKDQATADTLNSAQDQTNNTKENSLEGTQLENYEPVDQVSELKKIDIKVGDGDEVKDGDTVTAHYTGAIAKDGKIFESSKDSGQPATFPLSNVIVGWQKGVPGMKVGGIRRLIIPADQAYGAQGSPPKIGPNEPLVFDIQLIKIGE